MAKRSLVPKPYAGGKWTEARARSFVMSSLRRGQWPSRYAALKAAEVGKRINPKSGRLAMHHECAFCLQAFPAKEIAIDHIETVVPLEGFSEDDDLVFGYNWNTIVRRLLCEPSGFQILCKPCHQRKTNTEKDLRKKSKEVEKPCDQIDFLL